MDTDQRPWVKPALGMAVGLVMLVAFMAHAQFGLIAVFYDETTLTERFDAAGLWAPLLVISTAIVNAGIGSGNDATIAPIALAAQAALGPVGGLACFLIGVFLCAIILFAVWRLAGQPVVVLRFVKSRRSLARFGPQNALMAIVFIGFCLPSMSVSTITVFAGAMSLLTPGRFAISTAAGLVVSAIFADGRWRRLAGPEFEAPHWPLLMFAAMVLASMIATWVWQRLRPASPQQ